MLEPPFAEEGFAARFDLLRRRRVDHVVVISSDLVMQPLGGMCEQVPVLVDRAALDRLPVSLPTVPPNKAASARRPRRVLVPARYVLAISASAASVRR